MNKKNSPIVNIGSSSMLVIFLILCLVTFSVLSLSSASSDYNFTKRIAERTTDYYSASNTAEELLNELDKLFANSYDNKDGGYNAYLERVEMQLEKMNNHEANISCDFTGNEKTVNITVPINNKQALDVTLNMKNPANSNTFYEVSQWQKIATAEWEGDTTLPLMEID